MTQALPPEIFAPARLAAVRASDLLDSPPEEGFDRLADLARMLLQAPFAFVTVVDETRSYWKACIGVPADGPRQNAVGESFCQYVVGTDEALIVGDAAADPRTAGNPSIALMGVAAWAGYPLRDADGQVLGSFCVVDTVVRDWTPRDVAVLETLAAAASGEVALRSAMAAATAANVTARTSQDRLSFLADVSDALAAADHAEAALATLAERLVPYLADWCLITVLDGETGRRRDIGRAHRDPALLAAVHEYADVHRPAEDSPVPTVIRTGEPVVIADLDAGLVRRTLPDRAARDALARLAPAAAAVFPLRGRAEPFGSIALYNAADRGAHTDGQLSVALEMSRRAGLLLDNARLHAQQQRIAEALQRSLLTAPPAIEGMDIAVRYRPATVGSRVGGDWYDAYRREDGSLALVIGDVAGHDLHAIGLMGQIRTMARSIGYDRHATPAETLVRVDEAMRGLGVDTLCTALIVHLDLAATDDGGTPFTWSSAGHPLPLVVRADGTPLPVDAAPMLMLGVRPATPRAEHTGMLPRDATMLLMTDGLFERRDRSLADGLAELVGRLADVTTSPLDDLCDALVAGVATDDRDDDIALLAVRATC